jgi:hypothetical protein
VSENVPSIRTLSELEEKLSSLSHSDAALNAIKDFAAGMRDSRERLGVFNASGAIVRSPILSEDTKALGFNEPDDDFGFLQGDVISTESAYFLGERVTNSPKYVVLSSPAISCQAGDSMRHCCASRRFEKGSRMRRPS